MKKRHRCRSAFTIIEILIVVSILAIFATIATYTFGTIRQKGRDTRRLADISSVMKAMSDAEREGLSLAGACAGTVGPYRLDQCSFSPKPTEFSFDFTRLVDPSKSSTACTTASAAACQYSIRGATTGVAANPSAYRIYFYIETANASVSTGLRTATADGIN